MASGMGRLRDKQLPDPRDLQKLEGISLQWKNSSPTHLQGHPHSGAWRVLGRLCESQPKLRAFKFLSLSEHQALLRYSTGTHLSRVMQRWHRIIRGMAENVSACAVRHLPLVFILWVIFQLCLFGMEIYNFRSQHLAQQRRLEPSEVSRE